MKEGDVYIEKEKESQWSNQGEARSCVCIIPLSLSLSFLFHPLSPRNHSSTIPFLYLLIRFILVSLYTIYFYILFFVSLFFISYSLLLVFLSIPISSSRSFSTFIFFFVPSSSSHSFFVLVPLSSPHCLRMRACTCMDSVEPRASSGSKSPQRAHAGISPQERSIQFQPAFLPSYESA